MCSVQQYLGMCFELVLEKELEVLVRGHLVHLH